MGHDHANPEFSLAGKVDRLCDQFEERLREGAEPRIEAFLEQAADGAERRALLMELLMLELDYLDRQAGPTPGVEHYAARFPDDRELIQDVVGKFRTTDSPPSLDAAAETLDVPATTAAMPFSGGHEETLATPHNVHSQSTGTYDSVVRKMADAPSLGSLGDYTLLELLGQGGMGVVYRAIQRSADRLVALKVIRPDHLTSLAPEHRQSIVERFRTEARAAARLDHENVVRVYDVEEEDGVPYYAMQYIAGENLAERTRVRPCANQEAARYLEPIGRVLAVAHQEGILHRDIKPQNILIEESTGSPKLTDFGLAKLLEGEISMTMTGDLMGSPPYASPEQLRDPTQVDARSDMYSFGATLYHLLTGRAPFQAATLPEIIRQINADPPIRPSRLNPSVDQDLETICLKCLEKEPWRRYESMQDVAHELQRYLRNEPISARPLGKLQCFYRWCRRKPIIAGLGALAISLSILFVGTLIVSNLKVRAALKREEQQLERAEQNLQMAREVVEKFLLDVSDDPRMRSRGLEKWRQELLTLSQEFYDVFVSQKSDDAEMRREHALTYGRLAELSTKLGAANEGERLYRRAIGTLQTLSSEFPARLTYPLQQAQLLVELGILYRDRAGHESESLETFQQANLICEKLLEQEDPPPLTFGVLASSHRGMAMLAFDADQLGAAESHLLKAVSLLDRPLETLQDSHHRNELAMCENNLALVYVNLKYREKAEQRFSRALKIWAALSAQQPLLPEIQINRARCLDNLGDLLARVRRSEEGHARLEEALEIRRRLAEVHPDVPEYRAELATGLLSLGRFHDRLGKWALAAELYDEAAAMSAELLQDYPDLLNVVSTFAAATTNLGAVQFQQDRYQEAEGSFRKAAEAYQSLEQQQAAPLAAYSMTLENLARVHFETGAWDKWLTVSERRLAVRQKIVERHSGKTGAWIELIELTINLSKIYRENSEVIRAAQRLKDASRLIERTEEEEHVAPAKLAPFSAELGDLHASAEQWGTAEQWYRKSLSQLASGNPDPQAASGLETFRRKVEERLQAVQELQAAPEL